MHRVVFLYRSGSGLRTHTIQLIPNGYILIKTIFYRSSWFMHAPFAEPITVNYFEIYLLCGPHTSITPLSTFVSFTTISPFARFFFSCLTPSCLLWLLILDLPSVIQIEKGSTEFNLPVVHSISYTDLIYFAFYPIY